MVRALDLARRGPAHGPNPRVGAVLLDAAGRVLGEGWHRGAGTAHAEVAALDAARSAGHDPRGATMVVTLEPCRHTGRTGPCAEALLAAGVARVVHAVADPSAAGRRRRPGAAVRGVDVASGVLEPRAAALLRPWLAAVRARPPVGDPEDGQHAGRPRSPPPTDQPLDHVAGRAGVTRTRSAPRWTRSSSAPGPRCQTTRRSPRATTTGPRARTSRCGWWRATGRVPEGARLRGPRRGPRQSRGTTPPRSWPTWPPARSGTPSSRAARRSRRVPARRGGRRGARLPRAGVPGRRPAAVADLGVRSVADALRLQGDRRRADRSGRPGGRPHGGGLMFTGIVEELGTVVRLDRRGAEPGSRSRADVVVGTARATRSRSTGCA